MKAETAVKKFSSKLRAAIDDLSEEWDNWDSSLTGRKPKIDGLFERESDQKSNSENESVKSVSSDQSLTG